MQRYIVQKILSILNLSWRVIHKITILELPFLTTARSQMIQINSVTLIQQKWNILNPFPFKDGVNIIEYSNTNEYLEKIIYC